MVTRIDSAIVDTTDDTVVAEAGKLARLADIWRQIEERLEAEKERVVAEISDYPPPIPACDAQFNGLLEERAAIVQEVWEVKGIRKRTLAVNEHIDLLNAFLQSSRYLGSETAEEVRQGMQGIGKS